MVDVGFAVVGCAVVVAEAFTDDIYTDGFPVAVADDVGFAVVGCAVVVAEAFPDVV